MAIDQIQRRITSILHDASLSRAEKRDILTDIQEKINHVRTHKLFLFDPEELKPELLPIDGDIVQLDEKDESYQSIRASDIRDSIKDGALAKKVEQIEEPSESSDNSSVDGRRLLATA